MSTSETAILPCIVSSDWLGANVAMPGLVILDVRSADDYLAGHIPGSINTPSSLWAVTRDGLLLELPEKHDLFALIGSAGIGDHSSVVIVSGTAHPYPLADATRVAVTLIYAGVKNVAILDGGFARWKDTGRPVSTVPVQPIAVVYRGEVDETMFVSKDFVAARIGRSLILDTRDADVYFGVTREPFAERAGHIPTARCLPTPWVWTPEWTYRDIEVLKAMAAGVVGKNKTRQIIVYCGVGGYASTWWFILTRGLGYRNVKFYDGSAQEWTRDPANPVTSFRWE